MEFLTPQFFDILVIAFIISGVLLAAARIRSDFRKPPRFPDDDQPSKE